MTEAESSFTRELIREVQRLHDRIHGWMPASWQRTTASGGTRADRLRALALELADLGRAAGSGAPVGVYPPRVPDHALADQIVVLATDLSEALVEGRRQCGLQDGRVPSDHEIARRAEVAVRAARIDLQRPRS